MKQISIYVAEQSQEHLIKSMTRVRFLIREINGLRLPSNIQCRAKSIKDCSMDSEMKNSEKEPQYKNIPGPKALPLLGNWFRFLPYIGKNYFINLCSNTKFKQVVDYI